MSCSPAPDGCNRAFAWPRPVQARPLNWTAGQANIPVDLAGPLSAPVTNMKAPRLTGIRIQMAITISGVTGSPQPGMWHEILSRIYVEDKFGERVDVAGSSLRVINQKENGIAWQDGPVPSGAGTFLVWTRIPCQRRRAEKPSETRWNAAHLLDGGKMTLSCGPAVLGDVGTNDITVTGAVFTVFFDVLDELSDNFKMRIRYKDTPIQLAKDTYTIGGRLFGLWWYAGTVAEDTLTPWGPQLLTSAALALVNMPDDYFNDVEQDNNWQPLNGFLTATPAEDVDINGYNVTLFASRFDNHTTESPHLENVDIWTNATLPTGDPTLIMAWAEEDPQRRCLPLDQRPPIITSDHRVIAAATLKDPTLSTLLEAKPIGTPTSTPVTRGPGA